MPRDASSTPMRIARGVRDVRATMRMRLRAAAAKRLAIVMSAPVRPDAPTTMSARGARDDHATMSRAHADVDAASSATIATIDRGVRAGMRARRSLTIARGEMKTTFARAEAGMTIVARGARVSAAIATMSAAPNGIALSRARSSLSPTPTMTSRPAVGVHAAAAIATRIDR